MGELTFRKRIALEAATIVSRNIRKDHPSQTTVLGVYLTV